MAKNLSIPDPTETTPNARMTFERNADGVWKVTGIYTHAGGMDVAELSQAEVQALLSGAQITNLRAYISTLWGGLKTKMGFV